VCFYLQSHARLRVRHAPGIPHALFGRKISQNPGDQRRGTVDSCLLSGQGSL
jgi:hypothetical protein